LGGIALVQEPIDASQFTGGSRYILNNTFLQDKSLKFFEKK
jgi:hypothetical protein